MDKKRDKSYDEELVWTESEDGIQLSGIVIRPLHTSPKPVAVIHTPGWDMSSSHPLHILTSRVLAHSGYVSIVGGNRGWPFGEIAVRKEGYVMIGAGWERFDECPFDIGAWIHFAQELGFSTVALLGHSFGSAKVVFYQAQRQDERVTRMICLSPSLAYPPIAPEIVLSARALIAQGRENELLPWGSYGEISLSARTIIDRSTDNQAVIDVFGTHTQSPAISRIRLPVFVCYGTHQDIGSTEELEYIQRNALLARGVQTQLLLDANHTYSGHEQELGSTIAGWLESLELSSH